MGFFSKLTSMVGIGQPKVDFTLQSAQIKRGDTIKGNITITAGTKDIPVKFILIEHVEIVTRREWSDSLEKMVDRETKNTVNKFQIQKNDELLRSGTTMVSSFELAISESTMKTGYPYKHELKVSIDVPGLDPSKKQDIFIL